MSRRNWLSRNLAVERVHPVPKPRWTSQQDVREDKRRERDHEGGGVQGDDEQCPDETVSEAHAYLTISAE